MKRKLQLLTLLTLIPAMSACTPYTYPVFGQLAEGEKYQVGILLPVEHAALNAAKDGFITGLDNAGWKDNENIEFVIKNAQGNADDQKTMAKSLMSSCIMTLGLGTGASQDLKSAQKMRGSKNPILFTAVTDPVDAGLVKSLENKEGYVTGSSDAQPVDAQIDLVKDCIPDADKVGIFYTATETNSDVQAMQAKKAITNAGMTPIVKTCTAANDVQSSIASLVSQSGIDAIYIPTDNNVAANMNYVAAAVKGKNILVIVGEEGMLENGGHITLSISYESLGARTGEMAAKILTGEAVPSDLPIVTMKKEDCQYMMNSALLAEAGITLPEAVSSKCTDVTIF